MTWRIEELLSLYDSADELLGLTLDNCLTRMELNLDPHEVPQLDMEGDDAD